MKFESTCKNCILAELSNEDLELLKLSYDELDYSDEHVRDTIHRILDEASAETGIMLNRENEIRIDVMPDLIGGCLIIFSKNDETEYVNSSVSIFETDDFNNILDMVRVLKSTVDMATESVLYQKDEKYRLIVKNCDERLSLLLGEYMNLEDSDSLSEQRTREYWNCIIAHDALKVLCGN
ncbi:MAG: adaptor protein MecA [Faecalibacterium sp.]|nr:adaptor protein MecA [Ruminococcus sp.]MCM1392745.1 adaptor protein MecA [Ruminococcus sp.]MCM1486299.1 adaptor protein MecA [Faecalibacterium sp.]